MLKNKMNIKYRKTYQTNKFWAVLLLAQFFLWYFGSKVNFFIRVLEDFFEFQKTIHQVFFSKLPFSVGDIFYLFIVIGFIFYAIRLLHQKSRHHAGLVLLIGINVFYFTYQLFWGMLYFQKPIIDQFPNSHQEIEISKVKKLTLEYLQLSKKTRALVKEDEFGVFLITDQNSIENEILFRQTELPVEINQKKGTKIHTFKPSIFKHAISYTGILGYYNPFTAEAQYNPNLPNTYIPFTLSHESAHQLGYAREQEANFIGYLIGIHSTNIELRYSTQYFVLKSLLNSLSYDDPEFVHSVLLQYSEGMKRDRLAEKKFIKDHEGITDMIFAFTNDLFLKSNQQDGTITYSYFVDLLLHYEESKNKK